MEPTAGYWGLLGASVFKCQKAMHCLGGGNSTCREGHTGAVCAVCIEDWAMSGEGCSACEGRKGSPAMYIIVALTFVCMGACLLSCVWGFIYPQEKTEEEEKEKVTD